MRELGTPGPSAVLATSIALPTLCTFTLALRLYVRKTQMSYFFVEDLLCVGALIILWGMAIALIVGVSQQIIGYPTPVSGPKEVLFTDLEKSYKIEFIVELIQIVQLGLVKLSFVLLFKHIFVGTTGVWKVFQYCCWFMIGLITAWIVAFFIALLLVCPGQQVDLFWIEGMPTCGGIPFQNAYGLSDVLMDFLVIIMPLPMIWTLQMRNARKWAVSAVFLLGALTLVASVVRLIIMYQARWAVMHVKDLDVMLLITKVMFWSVVESSLALIAACLPLIYSFTSHRTGDLVTNIWHSLRSISKGTTYSGSKVISDNDDRPRLSSSASKEPIVHPWGRPATVDTYAMAVVDKNAMERHRQREREPQDILVARDVTQHSEIV